jgi:hypothetical protein
MSRDEKLRAMHDLRENLTRDDQAVPSPGWREVALHQTAEWLRKGKEGVRDGSDAKEELQRRMASRSGSSTRLWRTSWLSGVSWIGDKHLRESVEHSFDGEHRLQATAGRAPVPRQPGRPAVPIRSVGQRGRLRIKAIFEGDSL